MTRVTISNTTHPISQYAAPGRFPEIASRTSTGADNAEGPRGGSLGVSRSLDILLLIGSESLSDYPGFRSDR